MKYDLVRRTYNRVIDYLTREGIYGDKGLERLENWVEDVIFGDLVDLLFINKNKR